MKTTQLKDVLCSGQLKDTFAALNGRDETERYLKAIDQFEALYGVQGIRIYSAPGRSEISGNHTDHQNGEVLAAAINLDAIGLVCKSESIDIVSDQFHLHTITLDDLSIQEDEKGTSEALVRGICAKFKEMGYQIGGFKAYMTSEVLMGAGMSSSAAFEVLVGTILSYLYNDGNVSAVDIAKVSQYAENVYYGKPCGLMDQMASSVGSLVHIDFADLKHPIIERIENDFEGYTLCIVDTKGSHDDLTDDYAAVPQEMKQVATYFGKSILKEVPEEDFLKAIPQLREQMSDRCILRAMHWYNENRRVQMIVAALKANDLEGFKKYFTQSAKSSFEFLQNVYSPSQPQHQGVSVALALSENILGDQGFCRVHGGGFAGTIQCFVKEEAVQMYKSQIEYYLGEGTCHILRVRQLGGCKVVE